MALRMWNARPHGAVYFGNFQPWDSHDDILIHAKLAAAADAPIAALIEDLKSRGPCSIDHCADSERVRTDAMIQNSGLEKVGNGRDHNVPGFTALAAGGGFKGVWLYGATDDFGFRR